MKKLIILSIAILVSIQIAFAQKDKKAIEQAFGENGADLYIEADKSLLEPNENSKLSVIAVLRSDPNEDHPNGEEFAETVLPPNNSIYKATNWRIVQGGGNLVGIDETTQTYTAPAKLPAEKMAIISVDLVPQRPNLPKVQLLQTIYLTENETAFVVNVPSLGIVNCKYISKLDAGMTMPKVVNVPKNLPPEVRKQMEEAQKQSGMQNMDLNALSSNAVSIYDANQGFTAIRFSELGAQMRDGKINPTISKEAILAFNFNGKIAGSYQIGEKDTGLGFYVTQAQMGFGCGDTHDEKDKLPCNGKVVITEVDPKFIKGTVRATIYTSPPMSKHIFRGTFYGKFKVKRAN